ncbi:NYN domain-containing protein [Marinobacterium lutimaris]|uniref:OST-HTH/LOTUS domain-containing protein n=1 Tax=Marinobacterium lutimaris TaxID=568106 RepID=A0A1H5VMW6_9GAMM|nr:NYN domain-containing protein [Marinobacterium lutimaris]SEF88584.1 OST-HTH/LOTUS domain-containing protein [Marinobacterium lutimaris]
MDRRERDSNQTLAVLIDADNANPRIVDGLLNEVAKLGVASVKRIYGDWTTPNLGSWKAVLLEHSIQPIQQFRYTTGKNATDSAMIIDAMDLLYTGPFSGFCLVSSDSDFTRLAARIREAGKVVYGFGEMKTPKPFVAACDRFIYTEIFTSDSAESTSSAPDGPALKQSAKQLRGNTKLLQMIRTGIDTCSDDSDWANLGAVGSYLSKALPDFDPRNYGYQKLTELIDAIGLFEIKRDEKGVMIKDARKA